MSYELKIGFGQEPTASVLVDNDDYTELHEAVERQRVTEPDITDAMMLGRIGIKVLKGWAQQQRLAREQQWHSRLKAVLDAYETTADKEAFVSAVEAMQPE